MDEVERKYNALFAEHEALKEDFKAKDEECRFFMNEV